MQNNPLIQGLRSSGATITAQRIAICQWLYDTHTHPTAADVYAALQEPFPTMSLATVYNTLSLLEELGIIYQVGLSPDGTKRYDVNARRHINFVCQNCGKITDVYDDDLLNSVNRTMQSMELKMQEIIVQGICQQCRA